MLQLFAKKTFNLGAWSLDALLMYQKASNTDGIRIPDLLGDFSIYYTKDLFKQAAIVQTGFDVRYNSNQVIRGDESNQVDKLDGYAVVNLRGRYRLNENFEFFARIDNLFDEDYENFGLLGEEPSEVEVPLFENFSNPRFVGPGAPIAGFVGARVSF